MAKGQIGFQKGHPYYPGKSDVADLLQRQGGRRNPTVELKDMERQIEVKYLPRLIEIYAEIALDGKHEQLFIYLYDRIRGKPKATTDINIELEISADQAYALVQRLKAQEQVIESSYRMLPAMVEAVVSDDE